MRLAKTQGIRFIALTLILAAPGLARAEEGDSPHQEHMLNPPEIPPSFGGGRTAEPSPEKPERVVYGWFPTWVWKDGAMPRVRWDLLTHISYFSVEQTASGTFKNEAILSGAHYLALRDTAKEKGVKITVTVTNFAPSEIAQILATSASRTNSINNIVKLVKDAGAEGVNIDYEFVPAESKANFTAFMQALTTKLHTELPGSHITLAGPTLSHSGNYDYDALLEGSDGILPMYYGCAGSWSQKAAALAPLDAPGNCNLRYVVEDYFKWGKIENRHKLYVGLPFYGHKWGTSSSAMNAPVVAHAESTPTKFKPASFKAVTFAAGLTQLNSGPLWDSGTETPWANFVENTMQHQMWTEDGASLDAKLAYLVEKDVGGIGIWALAYEGESDDYWNAIRKNFVPASPGPGPGPTPVPGPVPVPPGNKAPIAVTAVTVAGKVGRVITLDGTDSSDADGDALSYKWVQLEGEPVTLEDATTNAANFAATQAGTYRFSLTVNDGYQDSQSAQTTVTVAEKVTAPKSTKPSTTSPQAETAGSVEPRGYSCRSTGPGFDEIAIVIAALSLVLRRRR